MADAFSDREKGFEAKFKIDAEMEFRIEARRNKLLGLWLAREFGLRWSLSAVFLVVGSLVATQQCWIRASPFQTETKSIISKRFIVHIN